MPVPSANAENPEAGTNEENPNVDENAEIVAENHARAETDPKPVDQFAVDSAPVEQVAVDSAPVEQVETDPATVEKPAADPDDKVDAAATNEAVTPILRNRPNGSDLLKPEMDIFSTG